MVSISLRTKLKPSPEPAGPTDYLPGSFPLHPSLSALQLLHPPCCADDMPNTCMSQRLHTCFSLCPEHSLFTQPSLHVLAFLLQCLLFGELLLISVPCLAWFFLIAGIIIWPSVQFSRSVVSNSLRPPWTAACQASLSITSSRSFYLISVQLNKYLFTELFVSTLNCRLWEVRACVSCSLLDPQPLRQ